MATLRDVGWLLPQLHFLSEGNAITELSKSFAHDGRLLGGLMREEQRRLRDAGSRRLSYAAQQVDVSRLRELLEHCKPDPFSLAAALCGGQETAARILLGKGVTFAAAAPHMSHVMSDAAVASTGPLLRELCTEPGVPRTVALATGVKCGLLDVIASARDGAFEELGFSDDGDPDTYVCACSDYIENYIHPLNAAAARSLAEHSFFTLSESLCLAMSENGAMLYTEAAEWVDELCQRIEGSDDTPEIRNLALAAAAATGAAMSVPGLLARGAVFDDALGPYTNGLLLAAQHGHRDVLRLLYSTPDDTRMNLFACVAARLTSCAKDLILHHGFEANDYHAGWDCTPLSLACALVDARMVGLLLKRGANPQERHSVSGIDMGPGCWFPGQDPWLALLSSPRYGPQLPELGFYDDPPFETTIDGRIKIVELLVRHGSRPSAAAVAESAAEGRTDMFNAFSRAFQPGGGPTALVATAALSFSPSVAAAQFLLRLGALVSCDVLISACKQFDTRVDVVAALLSAPGACSVNARDSLGRSALTWAAMCDNNRLVAALLAAGANPSYVDCYGCTALFLARTTEPGARPYASVGDAFHFIRGGFYQRMAVIVQLLQNAMASSTSSG